MKKRKILVLLLCLTVVFAFTACGGQDEEDNGPTMAEENKVEVQQEQAATEENENYGELSQALKSDFDANVQYNGGIAVGGVGDTLVNDFFDWTVHSVKTAKETHGASAGAGQKFVIVNMTMKNTEDFAYTTGNYEFIGLIGPGESGILDTMDSFYSEMIADELELQPGQSITGDLVFKVDENLETIVVEYEEIYGDQSIGNIYWYELKLD